MTKLDERATDEAEEELIVCRCEEVTQREIEEAIASGCDSVLWVKRMTRAGMGLCQGQTCGRLVASLIAEHTPRERSDVLPDTRRPPVRTIPIAILEEKDDG
jgi:NAD(P)H-nitrite reductase large subunit